MTDIQALLLLVGVLVLLGVVVGLRLLCCLLQEACMALLKRAHQVLGCLQQRHRGTRVESLRCCKLGC